MTDDRGREDRQQEERTVRRRRDDATLDGGQALKLAVPHEIQNRLTEQNREWRWANDEGNRIHRLTVLDDWDKVEGVEPREVVIDRVKGLTCKAFLLSKPKTFAEADRRKADSGRVATEKAMLEGAIPNAGNQPASRPDNVYLPSDERGGRGTPINKIERGNQLI